MNFSEALILLRNGHTLARDGWNGKGMHLRLVSDATFSNKEAVLDPFIALKTVQETFVPWVPSQADLLATDYRHVLVSE